MSGPSERRRRHTLPARASIAALPAIVVTVLVAACLGWLDPSALCMLPALALSLVLALRRYPGEKTLVRLRGRPPRALRVQRRVYSPRRHTVIVPRGGLLLAWALAVRPPPHRALAPC